MSTPVTLVVGEDAVPGRTTSLMIVASWIVATGWLFYRDFIPSLGLGQINYERALGTRALEETVNWTIYRGSKSVGNLTTSVRPQADGRYLLQSQVRLNVAIGTLEPTEWSIQSDIHVNPLKRLERFTVSLTLPQARTELNLEGTAQKGKLDIEARLRIREQEIASRKMNLDFDESSMILDPFGQLDRLPDLRPGKSWRTQFVNPVHTLLTGSLSSNVAMESIVHTVLGTEEITWNETKVLCYKVEHRYQKAATHSWARVSDGKVLVQEVDFGGEQYRLVSIPVISESDPPPHSQDSAP